jgi:hypothetical protein
VCDTEDEELSCLTFHFKSSLPVLFVQSMTFNTLLPVLFVQSMTFNTLVLEPNLLDLGRDIKEQP